jgi:hypothetical protein
MSRSVFQVLVRLAGVRPGGVVPARERPTGRLRRRRRRRCRWRGGPARCGPGHTSSWCVDQRGSGFLHIAQRDPSIQRGGDERVAQSVRPDGLGDPGPAGHPPDDPPGAVVQPAPSAVRKMGPSVRSPIARAVRGASGTVTTLPPLRVITRVYLGVELSGSGRSCTRPTHLSHIGMIVTWP